MTLSSSRIAAAPISWGVWEANGATGWTVPADRYLESVRDLGLRATEFGPEGYLPDDGKDRKAVLAQYGLEGLGAFLPVMLFKDDVDPLPEVEEILDIYADADASVILLAAISGGVGYDDRPDLSDAEWDLLIRNLGRIVQAARSRGITPALHHHMGTMIQTGEEIDRLMRDSDIGLCLDTGHATIAGISPLELAKAHADRVSFVHLKDVRNHVARRVQDGDLSYMDALNEGIFCPLGEGDAQIAALIGVLEDSGYQGWYVMEQDVILASEKDLAAAIADVRQSLVNLLEPTK